MGLSSDYQIKNLSQKKPIKEQKKWISNFTNLIVVSFIYFTWKALVFSSPEMCSFFCKIESLIIFFSWNKLKQKQFLDLELRFLIWFHFILIYCPVPLMTDLAELNFDFFLEWRVCESEFNRLIFLRQIQSLFWVTKQNFLDNFFL